jgi:VanZ family protein
MLSMAYAGLLIWVVVIFVLSTDYFSSARTAQFVAQFVLDIVPAQSAMNPAVIELLTRKLAHWTEYFILALLCMGAFSGPSVEGPPRRRITFALTLGLISAVVDEASQSFVPSRTPSARDVLINALGFVCGTLFFYTCLAIKRVEGTVRANQAPRA